jgi:hypothetical protein
MEKVVIEEIIKGKQKEMEDKWTKWAPKLGYLIDQTIWKTTTKHART